ncbi:centromere protein I isoform X2 [Neopsephotus bourkii]|uniref:centromere protein I isoform X2 n=1 Tax=Neopsephotus bourkii TaxID=309878 RepID=UPI002AA57122|nr:centromere protein I isoform X2 [Neopsephotus bourkii]
MLQSKRSKTPKEPLQQHQKSQSDLSAWLKVGRIGTEKSVQDHQSLNDQENGSKQEESLEPALSYFANADIVNTRLLKSLIPESVVPETCVVSAVSWLCVSKCSSNIQVLFLRWLITVFDFIDHKEDLHALYGFFFFFLQEEKMCPYICHVLYLLTRKENVKPFRVRRLLDLQAKMGMRSHLQALLSLYKLFCPELVNITLPAKTKIFFKNAEDPWKAAIKTIRQRRLENSPVPQPLFLGEAQPRSQKRKWNAQLMIPVSSTNRSHLEAVREQNTGLYSTDEYFPVELLQSFPQLLQNIHRLEFPSRMGSVLTNPLLLHYLNCTKDESVYLRLYYWLGQSLQEECTWCVVENSQNEEEFREFLEILCRTQCFLQEGLAPCEEFLYRSLPLWDGLCCRSQILRLVSWIPLNSMYEMKSYLYEPLAQLFFTSSLYFKCSVFESLKRLLQNWLNWQMAHLDSAADFQTRSLNTTFSGLLDTVAELIHFVAMISTVALRLESNHTFLLYFILDFYETACDIYLKYNMPLLIMPPAGVFYPVLLGMDPVNLNQLCYIMYRYRANLVAAKENEHSEKEIQQFRFSSETYREYNQNITAMVGCLWTSNAFRRDTHPQGLHMDDKLLNKTGVKEFRTSFNIVYHPAMIGYAVQFLQQAWPDDTTFNFSLIKGKKWSWYLKYLYAKGLEGLKLFIESSISRISQASHNKAGNMEM